VKKGIIFALKAKVRCLIYIQLGASETSMVFGRLKLCPSRPPGFEGEGKIKDDYRL
jgi:hypothetical protein